MRAFYITLLSLLIGVLPSWSVEHRITVIASPDHCGDAFSNYETAPDGTRITLQANAVTDCKFVNWTCEGQVVGTSFQYRFDMPDHDVIYYANFDYSPNSPKDPSVEDRLYDLRVIAVPEKAGYTSIRQERYPAGKIFYNTAYTSWDNEFVGWYIDGELYAKDKTKQFTMPEKNCTIEARFEYNPKNPGSPNANLWDSEKGTLDIIEFESNNLIQTINKLVPFEERSLVSSLCLSGVMTPTNNVDYVTIANFENLTELDLSRITGPTYMSANDLHLPNLQTLHLPGSISEIYQSTFNYCPGLSLIYCNQLTPPRILGNPINKPLELVTVFVPNEAVEAYKASPYWCNMDIQTTQEEVQTIELSLPATVAPQLYKKMRLDLINQKNGQCLQFILNGRSTYTYKNILPNTQWSATIHNDRGEIFGAIETIQVKNMPVALTFNDIKLPVDLRITVLDQEENIVTNQTEITWLDAEGNYLTKEPALINVPEGNQYQYRIQLKNQALATVYQDPGVTDYTVDKRQAMIVCRLQRYAPITASGQISDKTTGLPLNNVSVSVTQTFLERFTNTQTTKTDYKGQYSFRLADVPTEFHYAIEGYYPLKQAWNGSAPPEKIALEPMKSTIIKLAFEYTQTPTKSGEASVSTGLFNGFKEMDYTLYNVTQRKAIKDFKLSQPHLVIWDQINPGDEIRINAKSLKKTFAPVMRSVTIDAENRGEATCPIVEYGHLYATYDQSTCEEVVGILYDANGQLVKTEDYEQKALLLEELPDGNYTLVTMQKNLVLNHVGELATLNNTNLKNGEDYAAKTVTLKSGELTTVSLGEVPAIQTAHLSKTGIEASMFSYASSVVVGNYATLLVRPTIDESIWSQFERCQLVVKLPTNCRIVRNSVMIGDSPIQYEETEEQLVVDLVSPYDPIRFCVKPTQLGTFNLNAMLSYVLDGQEAILPVGHVGLNAEAISLSVPTSTPTPKVPVSGLALPEATVEVYDNGTLIGQTKALLNGQWLLTGELSATHNLSSHQIQAIATTKTGEQYKSEIAECVINNHSNAVSKVTMYHNNPEMHRNYEMVFDFLNPSAASDSYIYYIFNPQFTFTITFTRNDPKLIKDVVLYVKTSKSGWHPLEATYDEKQGLWVAMGHFGATDIGDLPINVSVDFEEVSDTALLDNNYLRQNYALLDTFKDTKVAFNEPEIDTSELDAMTDEQLKNYLEANREEPSFESTEPWSDEEQTVTLDDGSRVTSQRTTCAGLSEAALRQDTNYTAMPTTSGSTCYLKRNETEFDFVDFANNTRLIVRHEGVSNLRADWTTTIAGMTATLLSFVNTLDEYNSILTNLLKKSEISSQMSFIQAEAEYARWTTRVEVVTTRAANPLTPSWGTLWNCELAMAKTAQQACKLRMTELTMLIRNLKMAISAIGAGVDLAINARKGYEAIQDWHTILGNIQAVNCPGMDKLLSRAWQYCILVNASYLAACTADVYTLKSLTKKVSLTASLASFNISIYGAMFADLANQRWQWEIRSQIPSMQCGLPEPRYRPEKKENGGTHKSNNPDKKFGIDPSGYVYEGVFSNRVEGAKTTLYYLETSDNPDGEGLPVIWDASTMAQENPLFTDINGYYRWDVPEGLWQVKYEKQGYETMYSDWLPVPPPQLDVNMGMRQLIEPTVQVVKAYEDAVEITFDKYMLPGTLTTDNIKVRVGDQYVSGTLRLLNEEVSYKGNTDTYASKVRFDAEEPFNAREVTVFVSYLVTSYADISMAEDYLQTIPIEKEVKEIVCEQAIMMDQGTKRDLAIQINPKEAAAGRQLLVSSSTANVVSPKQTTITIDNNGKATVTIEALLPGNSTLTFQVADCDLQAETQVNVTPVETIPVVANPTTSLPTGSTVELGSTVTLTTETIGATIYYTTDGTCPCDPSPSVITYDEKPITFNKAGTFTIKAMAKRPDYADSEVSTFTYTVINPSDIATIEGNELVLYPLPVKDKLHIRSGEVMRSISLLSVSGQLLHQQDSDKHEDDIYLSSVPSGVYILRIVTDDNVQIRKVIKQ